MDKKIIKSIAIEGVDGSGKRTTSVFIAEVMRLISGKAVEVVSFPQHNTTQSILVDKFLYEGLKLKGAPFQKAIREGLLYSIDRMVTLTKENENGLCLIDEMNSGDKILIFDRYLYSNFIHRCNDFNEEDLEEYINIMEFIEFTVMGLPKPDLVFVLDVDPKISHQNILKRGREIDENETLENLTKSHNNLKSLCESQNYIRIECCKEVNGILVMKSTEEIADQIFKCIGAINHQ